MTSVEFLIKFCLNDLPIQQWNKYNGLFEQAKEMEKKQIINTWYDCKMSIIEKNPTDAEQYYNEKFKKE